MSADLAQLAASLETNEAFQAALDNRRKDAIDGLIAVKPSDAEAITKFQATVAVVDEIRSDLAAFIRAGKTKDKPGIA